MIIIRKERLLLALRNQTDGFMATRISPRNSGLPMVIIFNCYGTDKGVLIPRRHRKMIVEIVKDKDLSEMIPVAVSEHPKVLLKGKRLKRALALFDCQEWESLFEYIKRNRLAIERHWIGETDSIGLFEELKIRGYETEQTN